MGRFVSLTEALDVGMTTRVGHAMVGTLAVRLGEKAGLPWRKRKLCPTTAWTITG
jgi:hypothetical protein